MRAEHYLFMERAVLVIGAILIFLWILGKALDLWHKLRKRRHPDEPDEELDSSADTAPATVKPPRLCPACGQDLTDFPYYRVGIHPIARRIRQFAALLLPVMAVFILIQTFSGGFAWGQGGGGMEYLIAVLVSAPSFLLYALTVFFPKMRIVYCLRCSWHREYPGSWLL